MKLSSAQGLEAGIWNTRWCHCVKLCFCGVSEGSEGENGV